MTISIRFTPKGTNFGGTTENHWLGEVEVRNQNGTPLLKEKVVQFSTFKTLSYILKTEAGGEVLELLRKLDSACNQRGLR